MFCQAIFPLRSHLDEQRHKKWIFQLEESQSFPIQRKKLRFNNEFTLLDLKTVEMPGQRIELISQSDALLSEIDSFHDFYHSVVGFFRVRTWIKIEVQRRSMKNSMWRLPGLSPIENPYSPFLRGTYWSAFEITTRRRTIRVKYCFDIL